MNPPWIKFPSIKWGSMGWRMGGGEDYWCLWCDWYRAQSKENKIDYKIQWSEPEGWEGFYDLIEHGTLPERAKKMLNEARTRNKIE